MRFAGMPSWAITIDDARELTKALYVRDVAGLDTSPNADAPGPLDPPVMRDPALQQRFAGAAPAWNAWWSRLLRVLATAPTQWAALEDAVSQAGADVRPLLEAGLPAAQRWSREQARFRMPPPGGPGLGHLVRSVEAELGRAAKPFRLTILTLPVRGPWHAQVAVGQELPDRPGLHPSPAVLMSEDLVADAAARDRVLRPLIAWIA